MDATEISRVEDYLRKRLGAPGLSITARTIKTDSAEVMLDGEFLGVLFKDDEDGETAYDFHLTILDTDLEQP